MTIAEKMVNWRRKFFTKPVFKKYSAVMPTMSQTERDAIAAGTVTFEADLFRGNPDWQTLLALKTATLTTEEQAFLDGPVNQLCSMINDWEITHQYADLPPAVWQFMREQGFFGLIIPKEYGGKGFSALAHSAVIVKVSGLSITASTTIAVPNSLGPAELLLHYGTNQQKDYYLPRLAKGTEIPCFALTSPDAGSDASAMTDHGIVCVEDYEGKKTLGIKLHFDKRYITLAPIATVIGLAFKLYDPDHLLGENEDIGITCALIPRQTPGITIGRRHFPLNAPFQNGPIKGDNVFIPIDFIIGGAAQAGNGWRMLMECLAAGRAITLPSSAVGGAKVVSYTAGAYARIRKQFNTSIGYFEGIQELLAQIASDTYVMDAATIFTVSAIDRGEKPSVASAIIKYHVTELGRKVACDSMDIHGGKGICLGPNNYLGRSYQSIPIAITVEGANILTRNMIIFGQGAIRCHPFVMQEMQAAQLKDQDAAFNAFDKSLTSHLMYIFRNISRTFVSALTNNLLVRAPKGKNKHYFQALTYFSSAFAFTADTAMIALGSKLKRKENISARLGDLLSYLYLASSTLKHYQDQGEQAEDLPILQHAMDSLLYKMQETLIDIIDNFPKPFVGHFLRAFIFPLGKRYKKPNDAINRKIADLIMAPTSARTRLTNGMYKPTTSDHMFANVEKALTDAIAAEPIEKLVKDAQKKGLAKGVDLKNLMQDALLEKIISKDQYECWLRADQSRRLVIAVDDFANKDLAHTLQQQVSQHESF